MNGTLNKVMLIGHTGDDVKMHYFEDGNSLGRFPVATNETYTNRNTGEKINNTEWHNVVVRNKAAEACEKYLKKGDKIYIEGRIKTRKWQDDKGTERYSTEIHCFDFNFLTPKGESNASGYQNQPNRENQPNQNPDNQANETSQTLGKEEEDDLPF